MRHEENRSRRIIDRSYFRLNDKCLLRDGRNQTVTNSQDNHCEWMKEFDHKQLISSQHQYWPVAFEYKISNDIYKSTPEKCFYVGYSISFQTFLYRNLILLQTLENSLCYCYISYDKTDQFLRFQVQMNNYSSNWNTPYETRIVTAGEFQRYNLDVITL